MSHVHFAVHLTSPRPSLSHSQNGKYELASGLSLKSYGPPTPPLTLRRSGWDYIAESQKGGQQRGEHRVVQRDQEEHY